MGVMSSSHSLDMTYQAIEFSKVCKCAGHHWSGQVQVASQHSASAEQRQPTGCNTMSGAKMEALTLLHKA